MGKTDCGGNGGGVMISSVQSLSHVRLFVTPWAAARQASLYITSTEFTQTHVHWVGDAIQPSHPLSSPFPTALNLSQLRIFSNESVLHIRWPKYWSVSFSISLSNEYSGLISFRIADWISLQSKGFSRVFSNITVQKHQFFSAQLSLYAQQIFNLIFFWWTGLCSLSVVDLRPNYGGGNDDNYNLLLKVPWVHCCTQCPWPCSRPLLIHASTRDPWTGKSGWVSSGVTALFSWVLVCTVFCLCPPRVCFPTPV